MKAELKKVFERAKQELINLRYRWTIYTQIYGTNTHRLDLVNKAASNVFAEFQWLIIDDMILSLSKLTDPARTGGNRNLSFSYIKEEIQRAGDEELATELAKILEELKTAVEKFRPIRNKRIAHNDLTVAIDSIPLPGVSRTDINKALGLASDFLNKIEGHHFNSRTQYNRILLPQTSDGRALLIWLQKGLAYEALENEGMIKKSKWREFGNIDA